MIELRLIAILAGCALDACFGDPYWLPHPVCKIGGLIEKTERFFRKMWPEGENGERKAGICMTITVLLVTGIFAAAVLALAYRIHPFAGVLVESVMCYQMMAWRSLKTESMKVYHALASGDVNEARKAVSMIVGRDTKTLDDRGIAKAAIETVAENTSDGIIAPLLFMILGGGPGIYLYKAVNTMDSMVGYQNEKYKDFGWASAKLDDVCNYIPARLSALLMMGSGYLCQLLSILTGRETGIYSGSNGVRIFKRDRYHHKSPNSAQTEAVCAGVLQIELAGNAYYFGKLCEKPTIGDGIREVEYEDIRRANRLMTGGYLLGLAIVLILSGMVVFG